MNNYNIPNKCVKYAFFSKMSETVICLKILLIIREFLKVEALLIFKVRNFFSSMYFNNSFNTSEILLIYL